MPEFDARGLRTVEIVALACVASVAVTVATGLPIVRIVVREAAASGDRDAKAAGEGAVTGARQGGWAILPFDDRGGGPWPAEIGVDHGRLVIDLPGEVSAARFEEALHEALAGYRLRIEECEELVTQGRSVWRVPVSMPRERARLGAIAAHALFIIDPTRRLSLVARSALQARRAVAQNAGGHR